jgi:hypothetical protein
MGQIADWSGWFSLTIDNWLTSFLTEFMIQLLYCFAWMGLWPFVSTFLKQPPQEDLDPLHHNTSTIMRTFTKHIADTGLCRHMSKRQTITNSLWHWIHLSAGETSILYTLCRQWWALGHRITLCFHAFRRFLWLCQKH